MIMTRTPLPGSNWLGRLALAGMALLLLLSPSRQSQAQPPKKEAKTVQGVVQRFTTGPKGDVHGLVLDDDTEVRFPPHLGDKVTAVVAKKDRVQVKGELHTGPKGDSHLRAQAITNLKTGKTVALDDPPPKKKGEAKTVQGVVQRFRKGPKGEVNGLVLADGSEVHFPPHLGEKVTAVVATKDRVEVKGELHTGPKGDSHLRAQAITNLKTGKTVALDAPPPKKKGNGPRE